MKRHTRKENMKRTKWPSLKNEIPARYSALLARVKQTLLEGQRKMEEARVYTYWKTGWVILAHILKYFDRAEYGTEVIRNLARDIKGAL